MLHEIFFCFEALADKNTGTIYSDPTGKFPVRSYKNNQRIFLAYVYDANAVIFRPIKSREATYMLEAFQDVYQSLKNKHVTPKLHIMDNECSMVVKNFVQQKMNTTIQFV